MEQKTDSQHEEFDFYEGGSISSAHGGIPKWLWFFYIAMPLWGLVWFYLYWNGSSGWLDNGYWQQLQRAANTTSPYVNVEAHSTPEEAEAPVQER